PAVRMKICRPICRAAVWMFSLSPSVFETFGLTSMPIVASFGTNSSRNCRHFESSALVDITTPVRLRLGRFGTVITPSPPAPPAPPTEGTKAALFPAPRAGERCPPPPRGRKEITPTTPADNFFQGGSPKQATPFPRQDLLAARNRF